MMTDEPFGGLSKAMSLSTHGNSTGVDEGIWSMKAVTKPGEGGEGMVLVAK